MAGESKAHGDKRVVSACARHGSDSCRLLRGQENGVCKVWSEVTVVTSLGTGELCVRGMGVTAVTPLEDRRIVALGYWLHLS